MHAKEAVYTPHRCICLYSCIRCMCCGDLVLKATSTYMTYRNVVMRHRSDALGSIEDLSPLRLHRQLRVFSVTLAAPQISMLQTPYPPKKTKTPRTTQHMPPWTPWTPLPPNKKKTKRTAQAQSNVPQKN